MKTLSIILLALVGLTQAHGAIQAASLIPTNDQLAASVLLPEDATGAVIADIEPLLMSGGCVPTCVGMILDYNRIDFPVVSDHYLVSYFLPYDEGGYIIPDRSENSDNQVTPDCIAEILHTSFSADGMPAGWTKWDLVEQELPKYFDLDILGVWWFEWDTLTMEIDAGRPLLAQVNLSRYDSDGGHCVVITGYAVDSNGNRFYGCLNTWQLETRWYPFAGAQPGTIWGLTQLYTLHYGLDERTLCYLEELLATWWWKAAHPFGNSLEEYNNLKRTIGEIRTRIGGKG
jgi:hypothetical protein